MGRRRQACPWRGCAVAFLVATLVVTGCGRSAKPAPLPVSLRLDWHEVALPVPPGPAGRLAVRAAANCSNHWYLTGAVIGADDASRPATWTSADDGATWQPLKIAAFSFYGQQDVLYSVAC